MALRVSAASLVIFLGATAALASGAVSFTMKSAKSSALGTTIVVNSAGKTLYRYRDDTKNTVKCTGACTATWPPLLVGAGKKPVAGAGVTASKLGTVKRSDGKTQVTYGGYALYLYAGDSKAGDVNGQGLEGEWHAVSPSGAIVTKAASAGGAGGYGSGAATTTTSGDTGGAGYGY